jgi:hypothetical protein
MPSRILREGILTSRPISNLSEEAELFYRRLMSVVDDYGRFEDDPEVLLLRCFPFRLRDWNIERVERCIAEVSQMRCTCVADDTQMSSTLLTRYCVAGRKYLQINNFRQTTRAKSKCPDPACVASATQKGLAPNTNTNTNTITDTNTDSDNADFLNFESTEEAMNHFRTNPLAEGEGPAVFLDRIPRYGSALRANTKVRKALDVLDSPEARQQILDVVMLCSSAKDAVDGAQRVLGCSGGFSSPKPPGGSQGAGKNTPQEFSAAPSGKTRGQKTMEALDEAGRRVAERIRQRQAKGEL